MSVPEAVLGVSPDWRVRLAMLMGSRMEGGWDPSTWLTNPGDNGHSFGPFQINLPFHPDIDQAGAVDPATAAAYMVGAYTDAVAAIPGSLWSTNPEQAGEEAAVGAERPAVPYYASQGSGAVDAAYNAAQAVLGGRAAGGQLVGDFPGTHQHVPGTGGGHGWNPFGGVISGAEAVVVKAIFVVLGVGLVGAGLWRTVAPHTQTLGDNAMSAAKLAAL